MPRSAELRRGRALAWAGTKGGLLLVNGDPILIRLCRHRVSEQLFLQLLALGLLTSVTPWGIVAVIILLSAKSRPRGAVAFIAGWIASIFLTGGLIIGTYSGARSRPGSSAGNAMLGIQFMLGVLLLVLAAKR